MVNQNVEQKVIEITANTLRVDAARITVESHFIDDLNADSLDQVELMMAIEGEFQCDIPDEDAAKIATVADVVRYITQHTAGN